VVVLSGEPGIGKSRLTAAIQETIRAEPHIRLRFFCSPHHQNSAFHPFIAQLERAAAFTRDDTPEGKLGKLEALLGSTTPPRDDVALLAGLLSIPVEGRDRPPNMSPQRKKTRTFEALQRQLEALARQKPVLMIFEDMHWCDPTSRELLDLIVERAVRLPVLLIITSRPEFQPPWSGQAHVMILTLNRLDPHHGSALVERIAGSQVLPSAVVDEIVERTDGVPLFVEELTKAVVEAGPRGDDSARVISTMPLPPLAVPPTLYASLLARLDRLGAAAKEIAQIGAAIGREFGYEFLAAVTGRADTELQFILDQLASAGLIFRRGTPPQASFLFKHALVRDAAYGSLLRDRRRRLHADIAATLEQQFPEIAAAQPEQLARHWTEAGLPAKAIAYWFKAGEQALARSTMTEAAAQLRKGLALVPNLPDGVERRRHELDLQIALGRALIATQGYSASAAGDTYARARQLCEELNQPPQTTSVLYGQWLYHLNRAQLAQARQLAAEIRRSGDIHDDLAVRQAGCRLSGITCLFLGEFTTARSDLEESLRLYDPGLRHLYAALAVSDPRVATLVHSSQVLFYLGHLDQARVRRDQALGEARERAHPFTLAVALSQTLCGEWGIQPAEASLPHAEELVALSTEQDFPLYRALGAMLHGWCLAALGHATEGIALLTSGLAAHRATGSTLYVPFGLMLLAEAYGRLQQPEEALNRLDEAARLVEETQERWTEAELHRLRGELLISVHQNVAAEAGLQKALAVARRQGAKTSELRAATCLGRVWRDQGRHAEARALLAPIYDWFTEGSGTPNLRAAKVLLDELGEAVF
jgi:predicted ATPase